jgi:UDP-2,3-diacylglucosamine hydrolase
MVGPHLQYLELYSDFFNEMIFLIKSGKKIHFFEGNHDLHIHNLFKKIIKKNNLTDSSLIFHRSPWTQSIDGKMYYFSHGDELEPGNLSYKVYKKILMSKPIEVLVTHVAPYSLIEAIGTKASELSKKRGRKTYNEEKNRARFRSGAIKKASGMFDFIIAGHSHIQENVELKSDIKIFTYINNGFLPEKKNFIFVNSNQIQFVSLI